MTLQGGGSAGSNAPFQSMLLPAGVDGPADIVAFGAGGGGEQGDDGEQGQSESCSKGFSRWVRDA